MDNAGKEFFRKKYLELGGQISETKPQPSLRVNTLLTSAKELIPRLEKLGVKLERIPFTKNGYYYQSKFSLGAITECLLGYYYLQEAAAQLPVEVLDPKPTDVVLDCCAAPGGKTTQLAQQMKNQGTIAAFELKLHRIPSLLMNLERCGVTNTTAFFENVTEAKKLGIQFDKILLDAPCAGNYLTEEGWFEKRTREDIQKSSEIQRRLLTEAASLLKIGGILVYSTCSLEPEEDELNIQWAIENLPVKLEKVNLPIGEDGLTNVFGRKLNPDIALCKRFWPPKTEGFFIAKMVKL
ncbi:MAG: RsmB/NOP family class I SAM-dependent RNA methyltransferase [Candidatus Woesearchaeota archaeon]|nr:RsmB/NOP family class I SAM-dependent RNA methyltransferase [Candidatus Woesearchaeota archaeon]